MKRFLLLKTGTTLPQIHAQHGDFDSWFARSLGIRNTTGPPSEIHGLQAVERALDVIDVTRDRPLPGLEQIRQRYAGIIITGSPAMVSHRLSWSENAAAWIHHAHQHGIPMLGVCFGHQLIAHALGGRVGTNPAGRHIGTAELTLTRSGQHDPLLSSLNDDGGVHVTHLERVLEPPPGTTVLATVAADPHHALRYSEASWGVQFHPEFTTAICHAYVNARTPEIAREGLDPLAIGASVRETPFAYSLLSRFAELCEARTIQTDSGRSWCA